jgi:DNA-binding NarL/FixJ family response regulator
MLRVLLVEDSQILAERLREALAALHGVEVVGTVDTEREAIAAIRSGSPDLLILDLQLKQGTGFGVLKSLGAVRPAVIVLTNYALPMYQKQAKEYGVVHFLNKSRDFERLTDLIAEMQPQILTEQSHLRSST